MFDYLIKKGLSVSVVVGTLLIPLAAVAAVWISTPEPAVPDATPTTPASSTAGATPESDIAADLESACGAEGLELVSLEASATITDVQQAALDALRNVCQQHELPLPEPSSAVIAPPTPAPLAATNVADAVATVHSRDDENEFEHDDHDETEIEVEYESDDHEYEYEYEYEVDD